MKKSRDELINEIANCGVTSNETWLHVKSGTHYTVKSIAVDCNTNELRVNYETHGWTRPGYEIPFTREMSEWKEKFVKVKKRELWLTDAQYEEIRGRTNELD